VGASVTEIGYRFSDRIRNSSILITGGTGSFGTALVDWLLASGSGPIRIFSRDESKQDKQRNTFSSSRLSYILGDVRDEHAVEDAMDGIDYVFHAAALKQIPTCEFQPQEVLRTNVLGADVVMRYAERCGVQGVVLLSTDKAVNPISTMGLTKALMEKAMAARAKSSKTKTVLTCTRYGNVMGSRGSVIPLFIEQLVEGRPITVTDMGMTRFMTSMDEAIGLVLFALERAQPGEIFIRKSPAATIETLVQALQLLFGISTPVNIIGARSGEKHHETLLSTVEFHRAIDEGDFLRIPPEGRNGHVVSSFENSIIRAGAYSSNLAERLDVAAMADLLSRQPFVMKALGRTSRQKASFSLNRYPPNADGPPATRMSQSAV
jgi:UDP-N-acetylglucosamine 4,6-dehydratase